jgi:6-phosphofructokinase 1
LLCVPERPLQVEAFVAAVDAAYRHYGFVVVVVAETVRSSLGRPLGSIHEVQQADAFGHPVIHGTASTLVSILGRQLGLKARFDKPGTLQRMSGSLLSPVDIEEAYAAGAAAVRMAIEGTSGKMVGFRRLPGAPYRCEIVDIDLEIVANQQRVLPDEFLGIDPFGVTPAFVEYARPLIGPPLLPYERIR